MKIKTASTFILESEELAALGTVVDLLNAMMEESDEYGDADLSLGDSAVPLSVLNEITHFLDYLWAIGSASISTANYEEDDEQLSFDDFEEENEDYDGHDEV